MTHKSFRKYVEEFGDDVVEMVLAKNEDYAAGSDNPFEAFDEAAKVLGLTRYEVWAVFYMKHVQAIVRFIKEGKLTSEDSHSRLVDLAAYPAILAAMEADDSA